MQGLRRVGAAGDFFEQLARCQHFGSDAEFLRHRLHDQTQALGARHQHRVGSLATGQGWWRVGNARVLYEREQFVARMFDHALGHLRDPGERGAIARYALHDLAQHRVIEDPAARPVARHGTTFAPGGETREQSCSTLIPIAYAFESLPGFVGIDDDQCGVDEFAQIFLEPGAAAEAFEFGRQRIAQGQQITDIVERILDLCGRERSARPIGASFTFGKFVSEQAAYQLGIADLCRKTGERGGDLGVEQGRDGADPGRQHFEVLPRRMQHFDRACGGERLAQRTEVFEGERIDAESAARRGDLQQAEFGAIGTLAEEFGVETQRVALQLTDEVLEGRAGRDQHGGRRHRVTMQEFRDQGNVRMTSTLKTFFDILSLRAGPEDLPTSPRLLWSCFALLLLLQGGLGSWLMSEERNVFGQALLSGLISLGWLALLLRLFGKPERFTQTATAMLGVACVFAPIGLPVIASITPEPGQPMTPSPLALFAFVISLYLTYVNGRILRAALERPLFQCIVLFLIGEFLVFSLTLALGIGTPPSPTT
jgi:hypothetical protein